MPHGLGLHALQALPLLAALLALGSASERTRLRIVWLAAGGWSLLLASQILQAVEGAPGYRLESFAGGLVLLGALVLAAAVALTLRALNPKSSGRHALLD